jgi:serine/threonine protein kinase
MYVKGMKVLNCDLKIIHRDLKCENIFLTRNFSNRMRIKIGNFGLALHSLSNEDSRRFDVGTLNYMV